MVYNATHVTTAPTAQTSSWGDTFKSSENKNYLITFESNNKFSLYKKVGFVGTDYYYIAVSPGNNDKIKVTSTDTDKAGVYYVSVVTTTTTTATKISN